MVQDNKLLISIIAALIIHVGAVALYGMYAGGTPITPAKKIKIRLGDEKSEEISIPQVVKEPEAEPEKKIEEVAKEPPKEKPKKVIKKKKPKPKKVEKTLGSKYGNSYDKDAITKPTYLDLLRVTVQERSSIPAEAKQNEQYGNAILRLSFNRKGYVLKYQLVKKTGHMILDMAALQVGRTLTVRPFPPAPFDFDRGYSVMTYDFPVSFQP